MTRYLFVTILSALAFIAACGSQPNFATLVELSQAGVTVNGKPASTGQALAQEDEVKVDGTGAFARIVLPDGVRVFLRPDGAGGATTFNLGRHVEQGSASAILFKLVRGVAYLVVPKRKAGDALEVQASWTTTAVKGTEFKVESGEAGDTVAVKEGTVEVRANAPGGPSPTTVSSLVKVHFDGSKKLFASSSYEEAMGDQEQSMFGGSGPVIKVIETR